MEDIALTLTDRINEYSKLDGVPANSLSGSQSVKRGVTPFPNKLTASLERKVQELSVLYEISQAIGSTLNCQEVFPDILKIFHARLGMNRGTITLLNPRTGELEIQAAHGMTQEEVERGRYLVGEGITGKVVETGEPAVIPRIENEPLF